MPDRDTSMGGLPAHFPTTLWGSVLGARDAGRTDLAQPHLDQLIRAYWKPVYACIRSSWNATNEQAKDYAQEFFLSFLNRDAVSDVDPSKGTFRSYLKACLRHFMLDQKKHAGAAKRFPGQKVLSMDGPDVELDTLQAASRRSTPDETFDRAWIICLMEDATSAVERELKRLGRESEWAVFRAFEIDADPGLAGYAALADRFKMSEREVKTALQNVRRRLREEVRQTIGRYCSSPGELDREFAELFGPA